MLIRAFLNVYAFKLFRVSKQKKHLVCIQLAHPVLKRTRSKAVN